jgi:hypothetical protein
MIYLYCLTTPESEPPSSLTGLAKRPVRVVTMPALGLSAWVSDCDSGVSPFTAELARAHDRVVRAAMDIETPLPARFGQMFVDDDALRRSVGERHDDLARALARVQGAVEMTVRILLDAAGEREEKRTGGEKVETEEGRGAEETGKAYLARLRARQRAAAVGAKQADFLHARLSRAVREVVREEARTPVTPSSRSLTVSHLVDRGAIAQYRLALRTFVDHEPHVPVMISGPWAPYSFMELRRV